MAKRQKADESGDNAELQALFDNIAGEAGKPKLEVVAGTDSEESGDSDDLQNLFDSVSAGTSPAAPAAAVTATAAGEIGDSPELEALFDTVASGGAAPAAARTPEPIVVHIPQTAEERQESVFNKLGNLTRLLHDTLCELGYDKKLEETAQKLPDARQRLTYISQMTEQAASRVLNATDVAKPIQDRVEEDASALSSRWDKLYGRELSVDEFKQLAGDTRAFMNQVKEDSKVVNAQLLEIMMAQDFQDLTGQVIKRVVDMAQTLETELLGVLIQSAPEGKLNLAADEGLLNGPVVNAAGRDDVVTNQEQVDDLLESLGF
ncbi:protein phosphatase CheZ [Uliginosibacterium sp. H1]|uniref:protein phosphatase CheZ n=1 Tax=Uliginosibacterium sp. H1 TaxID=3114757 RepID=UPI002E17981C|nr:protein phosphatase CheZ [Uliginosibacterium sp. H1]